MMPAPPLFIVDILGEIVAAADAVLFPSLGKHINYEYGRSVQILTELQKLNGSTTLKNTKYPLVALFQDFPEPITTGVYYPVTLPKISIATLTVSTDPPKVRYDKNFRTILYPIYLELLRQIPRHKNIVGNVVESPGRKWDRPGSQPEGSNLNDYLDAIEIEGLQLTFKTVFNCKKSKT